MTLKSLGTLGILSINKDASSKASNSRNCRFLGDSALDLSLQAFTDSMDLLDQIILADNIINDLELKKSELITTERNGMCFAVNSRVETVGLSSLSKYEVIGLAFETPEALASGTAAGLSGIDNQSCFVFPGQTSQLCEELVTGNITSGRLHGLDDHSCDWAA